MREPGRFEVERTVAMTELMTNTLGRVTQAEEAVASLQLRVADSLARDGFSHETTDDLKKLVKEEIRRSLVLSLIRNRKSYLWYAGHLA